VLKATITLTESHLSKFPQEIHRHIIYSRFLRMKKFVSSESPDRYIYKNYIKEKVVKEPIPNLLNTLDFISLGVAENADKGADKHIARSILMNIIGMKRKEQNFLEQKKNQKHAPVFYKKDFEGKEEYTALQKYYEILGYFNKSLGLCL